jgi:DNA (cytosine-5)-methyltransferase 1
MTDWKSHTKILNRVLKTAKKYNAGSKSESYIRKNLTAEQAGYVKTLVDNAETQKSLIAVIITSLIKKIEKPSQDVRLHRDEFSEGYSGRSLDTNVVTPWLKEHFRRFAPKESGWLTRSIEQPHPFTKDFPGKIRNLQTKAALLSILEDIEENKVRPESYLTAIILKLLEKTANEKDILSKATLGSSTGCLTIDVIIDMLETYFSLKMASRLPVVAIYTIYQLLLKNVKMYQDKKLLLLKEHTTSDRHTGYADIEIWDANKKPFEMVEVKHKIPIDKTMVLDVLSKIKDTTVKRYFILTTAERNFKGNKKNIFSLVHDIKVKCNKDLIPNGIIPSLKYYLRLVPDLREFLKKYTKNLSNEFRQGTDIKKFHILQWQEITRKYKLSQ